MVPKHRLAEVAALIADPSRAAILTALEHGRALPAGELARLAGISPSTASTHLAKLTASGLVRADTLGRNRYMRLAGPEVAEALEALGRLVPPRTRAPLSGPTADVAAARLCYDHLAGAFGVAVTRALLDRQALELSADRLQLGPRAGAVCRRLDVDLAALGRQRRPVVRTCIDWTERREHVAGALGAAIASAGFERGWFVRRPGSRAIRITDRGRHDLRHELGLDWRQR